MSFSLSPAVTVTETDLTTSIVQSNTTVCAQAGITRWGPIGEPVLIDSEITFKTLFGRPDNLTANSWFTAANFLQYGSNLQFVRVGHSGSGGHSNATATGASVYIPNQNAYSNEYANGQGSEVSPNGTGMFAAAYPSDLGNSLLVSVADISNYATWTYAPNLPGSPNTSTFVANSGGTNDELHVIVIDAGGLFTGTAGTVLEVFPFLSKCGSAKSESGTSIYYADYINNNSNYIYWMDHPTEEQLGIVTAVNWGAINPNTNFQTLSTVLTTTSHSGSFTVGETVIDAAAVTVSPAGSGAAATATVVSNVITPTITNGGTLYAVAPIVTVTGNGTGATATATVSNGVVTAINVVQGTGYTNAGFTFSVPGSGATASVTTDANGKITAVTPITNGSNFAAVPYVTVSGPGSGAQITAVLGSGGTAGQVVSYIVVNGGVGYKTITGTVVSFANPVLTINPLVGSFPVGQTVTGQTSNATAVISVVAGGNLTVTLSGGVDGNSAVVDGDYITGFDSFQSALDIDISLLITADASSTVLLECITNIAESRRDCVVFLSPPLSAVLNNSGQESADVIAFRNLLPSSSYAVMDCNWKYQYDKYNDVYRWVPLNGDVAGLCVRTDQTNDPWWSPAGYNRGLIKNVVKLAWNPRQTYRDILYQNGINAVIQEQGQGTLLLGDKTMLSKPSAFDRINVRRLFIVLEKSIAIAAKYTLFQFNDPFTQAQFANMITPYLRTVQGRRGLTDFDVVCDASNNTPQVVDADQFVGDIYLKPARSINFIQLNFVAVGTGVAFNEIVGLN